MVICAILVVNYYFLIEHTLGMVDPDRTKLQGLKFGWGLEPFGSLILAK